MHLVSPEISGVGPSASKPPSRTSKSHEPFSTTRIVAAGKKTGETTVNAEAKLNIQSNSPLTSRTVTTSDTNPADANVKALTARLEALEQLIQKLTSSVAPESIQLLPEDELDTCNAMGKTILEAVQENGTETAKDIAEATLNLVEEAEKLTHKPLSSTSNFISHADTISEQSSRLFAKQNIFIKILGGLSALFGDLRLSVSGTKTLTDPLSNLNRPYDLQGRGANFLSNLSTLGGHAVGFLLELAPIKRCRSIEKLCDTWLNNQSSIREKASDVELSDFKQQQVSLSEKDRKDFEALVKGIRKGQSPKMMTAQAVAKLMKQVLFVIGTMVAALYLFGVISMGLAVGLGTGPFAVALGLMTGLALYRLYKMRSKTLNMQKLQIAAEDITRCMESKKSLLLADGVSKKTKKLYQAWLNNTEHWEGQTGDETEKLAAFQNYIHHRRLYEDPSYQATFLVEWLSGDNEDKKAFALNFIENSKELLGEDESDYGNAFEGIKKWTPEGLKDIFIVDEKGNKVPVSAKQLDTFQKVKDFSPYLSVVQKAFNLGV